MTRDKIHVDCTYIYAPVHVTQAIPLSFAFLMARSMQKVPTTWEVLEDQVNYDCAFY